jgi:hypothetical protein
VSAAVQEEEEKDHETLVAEAAAKRKAKAEGLAKLQALGYTGRTPGSTALHEAAHAVAAYRLGQEVIWATNLPTDTTRGQVKFRATGCAQVVVALMGRVVTNQLTDGLDGSWPPKSYFWARLEPLEDLGYKIRKFAVTEVQYYQLARIALEMSLDPEFMQQVALVASVLEEHRDLDGEQIKALVEIAQPT